MPTVMVHHDIKDKDHWLSSPKREEFFGPLGVTNIRRFVDPDNPTRVGLVMDVPDMDALAAAMETQEAADAEAYDASSPRRWSFSSRPSCAYKAAGAARPVYLTHGPSFGAALSFGSWAVSAVRTRGEVYGAAQESNLPSLGLPDLTGFEDRLGHRAHAAPGRSVARDLVP